MLGLILLTISDRIAEFVSWAQFAEFLCTTMASTISRQMSAQRRHLLNLLSLPKWVPSQS